MAVMLYEKGTMLEIHDNYEITSTEELRKLERDFVVLTKKEKESEV